MPLLVEKTTELFAVIFVKLRIYSGLQWKKAEQGCRKAVNRADLGALQIPQCLLHPAIELVLGQPISIHQAFDLLL
jgi:hypothetical protein